MDKPVFTIEVIDGAAFVVVDVLLSALCDIRTSICARMTSI